MLTANENEFFLKVFDFELSLADMEKLDNINFSLRAVDPAEIQAKIDDNLPDGYKLNPSNVCGLINCSK